MAIVRYMLPRMPIDDFQDVGFSDAKGKSELSATCSGAPQTPHQDNIRFFELGVWAGRALQSSLSSLGVPVSHVVGMMANPKVIGADTSGIVARMADHQAFGIFPGRQDVRVAVSEYGLLCPRHSERSISPTIGTSGPVPTSVRLLDLRPKMLGGVAVLAFLRAIANAVSPVRPSEKSLAALSARLRDLWHNSKVAVCDAMASVGHSLLEARL